MSGSSRGISMASLCQQYTSCASQTRLTYILNTSSWIPVDLLSQGNLVVEGEWEQLQPPPQKLMPNHLPPPQSTQDSLPLPSSESTFAGLGSLLMVWPRS